MKHEERMEIAKEIAQRIVEKHGEAISAIAIYGSVAKGEDAAYSDLEMWVATGGDLPKEERLFIYRDMPVEVSYVPEGDLLKAARRVDAFWPIQADALNAYVPLFDRTGFVERLQQAASDLPEDDFTKAISERMVRTHETIGKLKNAWKRGDHYGIMGEGQVLAWSAAMTLGLVNRRYYPSGRGLFRLSTQMPLQPKDYGHLIDIAGGFVTTEEEQIYRAALRLWDNLQVMVRGLGIKWDDGELTV